MARRLPLACFNFAGCSKHKMQQLKQLALPDEFPKENMRTQESQMPRSTTSQLSPPKKCKVRWLWVVGWMVGWLVGGVGWG